MREQPSTQQNTREHHSGLIHFAYYYFFPFFYCNEQKNECERQKKWNIPYHGGMAVPPWRLQKGCKNGWTFLIKCIQLSVCPAAFVKKWKKKKQLKNKLNNKFKKKTRHQNTHLKISVTINENFNEDFNGLLWSVQPRKSIRVTRNKWPQRASSSPSGQHKSKRREEKIKLCESFAQFLANCEEPNRSTDISRKTLIA